MRIEDLTPEAEALRELGRRLGLLRKQRGLSQEQLATSAGIGVATLRRIEAGQDAQLATWLKLLRTLGLTTAIDALVPEHYSSPMTEVLGPRRRAVRRAGDNPIRWGDEEP
jgi:transcriptional regulator with XRE-family HTH domain